MWSNYRITVLAVVVLWILGIVLIYRKKSVHGPKIGAIFIAAGIGVLLVFIVCLWEALERPPLRTLGETRLLYALFLSSIGLLFYWRWRYVWLLAYSILFALFFLGVNIADPEVQNKTLMPALQSPWFVPHVVVYIFSYALLGASFLVALKGIITWYQKSFSEKTVELADNLVYCGFAFLTLGLLFGALWAKEAWGDYWTWDPKEIWALITWIGYLIYIHIRLLPAVRSITLMWILAGAFIVLSICWFGVNYMPAAKASVHMYTN